MKQIIYVLIFGLVAFSCAQQKDPWVYQSESLKIEQTGANTYRHITYLETDDFGKVACNGMIIISDGEALVFDTPSENEVSKELIDWLEQEEKAKVVGVIPTHFHLDGLGGLEEFHRRNIPSIANNLTLQLAEANQFSVPKIGFEKDTVLTISSKKVHLEFMGKGHTRDNIIGYFPEDRIIFGGCLIKAKGAGDGYLGDSDLSEWSVTMEKILLKYPDVEKVIPGHGDIGGLELIEYTRDLFGNRANPFDPENDSWIKTGDAEWKFEGNEITGTADNQMGSLTTREQYRNFELSLDFYPDSTVNSGVFIRCKNQEMSFTDCYEINIWDLHPIQDNRTGSVVEKIKPLVDVMTIGKWNTYKIEARDQHIQAWINGTQTINWKDSLLENGFIAIQAGGTGVIRFRNIQLRILD